MEHFQNPHNMGKINEPSAAGRVGNPVCGDLMELQLKIVKKENEEIIENAKFQTFGCGAAIATSSILTDMIIGKTLKEASKITDDDIIKGLGGLPPVKRHCSLLARQALEKAIEEYEKKK